MRKTITVPAAGVSKSFQMTGKSILILSGPIYQSLSDFAKISFNNAGEDLPGVPRSTFQFSESDCFERLVITGTSESAGDEIEILATNSCLGSEINTNILETEKSIAGATQTKPASDDVQQFSDLELTDDDGNLPKRLYIWVVGGATAGINYAYDANPSQGLNATDALQWDNDQSNASTADHEIQLRAVEIVGIDWIKKFRFISTVNLEAPNLVWTAEY